MRVSLEEYLQADDVFKALSIFNIISFEGESLEWFLVTIAVHFQI